MSITSSRKSGCIDLAQISETDVRHAYSTARLVYDGTLTEREGIENLVKTRGMNGASASDFIRNFAQMMKGKSYHRTLNRYATRYYLENIISDYGEAAGYSALSATRAHIIYYEGVSKSRAISTREVCDDIETTLLSPTSKSVAKEFSAEVEASQQLSSSQRLAVIAKRGKKRPDRKSVTSSVFLRCPHVVAEVLKRAGGLCENCDSPAPFMRKKDNSPYLEVHHKMTLANGGEDTVENAEALCPNCHRMKHHG